MIDKRILLIIFLFYLLLVLFYNIFVIGSLNEQYLVNNDWKMRHISQDGSIIHEAIIDFPYNKSLKKGEAIAFEKNVILSKINNMYLYMNNTLDQIEVFQGKKMIYSFGKENPVGKRFHFIPIHSQSCKKKNNSEFNLPVKIKIMAVHSFNYKIDYIAFMNYSKLVKYVFTNDIVFYMISGFVLSLTIIFFIAFIYDKASIVLFFSGLLMFLIALWNFSIIPSMYLFSNYAEWFPYIMKITGILLLPVFAFTNYHITGDKIFYRFGYLFILLGLAVAYFSGFSRLNFYNTAYFGIYAIFVFFTAIKLLSFTPRKEGNIVFLLYWAYFLSFGFILLDVATISGLFQLDYLFNQWSAPIYGFSLAFYLFLDASYKMRQREVHFQKLTEIKYKNLLTSINPHFLFNSLSTIFSLIITKPRLAKDAVLSLSDVYRHIITAGSRKTVLLEDEWNDLISYTNLLNIRFPERYTFDLYLSPGLKRQKIPPLVVHTIIESIYRNQKSDKIEIGVYIKRIKDYQNNNGIHFEIVSTPYVNPDLQIRRAIANIHSFFPLSEKDIKNTGKSLRLSVISYNTDRNI